MASKRERSSSIEDTTNSKVTVKRSKADDVPDDGGEGEGERESHALSRFATGIVQQAAATTSVESTEVVRGGTVMEGKAEAVKPTVSTSQLQPQSPARPEAPPIRTPPSILRRWPPRPHTSSRSPSSHPHDPDTNPTTPTRTPNSARSVRINLDSNTFLSSFSCVSCEESFGSREVMVLSCGHYLCVHCAVDVIEGEGEEGLERCGELECGCLADGVDGTNVDEAEVDETEVDRTQANGQEETEVGNCEV